MDGAVAGALAARDTTARQLARYGDPKAAAQEKRRPVVMGPSWRRQIVADALVEAQTWIEEVEKKVRAVLMQAVEARQLGVIADPVATGRQAAEVSREMLEPAPKGAGEAAFAARSEATSLEQYRRDQTQKAIWRRQQRELEAWRAGRRKEPVWHLKARQATVRMRTGWNKWHNNGAIRRAASNVDVLFLTFTLGNTLEHTELCKARAGMTLKKDDPRVIQNKPPLHWGCKSKWIPITRQMAQAEGIKKRVPRSAKKKSVQPDPQFLALPAFSSRTVARQRRRA